MFIRERRATYNRIDFAIDKSHDHSSEVTFINGTDTLYFPSTANNVFSALANQTNATNASWPPEREHELTGLYGLANDTNATMLGSTTTHVVEPIYYNAQQQKTLAFANASNVTALNASSSPSNVDQPYYTYCNPREQKTLAFANASNATALNASSSPSWCSRISTAILGSRRRWRLPTRRTLLPSMHLPVSLERGSAVIYLLQSSGAEDARVCQRVGRYCPQRLFLSLERGAAVLLPKTWKLSQLRAEE